MQIDNHGVTLHVDDDGTPDGPVVLFLHGITAWAGTWDWALEHLAARYRILRLDFRGHGRSGRAPGTYHFPAYLSDAIAVCEQVAGGKCVVVGHSLGGGTAAALAQQRPDLVHGVLLEDPALMSSADREAALEAGGALLTSFALMRQAIPLLQAGNVPVDQVEATIAAAPTPSGATMGESVQPDALRAMAEGMLMLDASVLDPVLEGSVVTSFDPFAPITVPVTVLAADPASPDCVAGTLAAQRLAATTPHADFRVVAGAGHLIHDSIAYRDTFRDALVEFCSAHAG